MMTKPWTPPPHTQQESDEAVYPVDLPCFMSGAGMPFEGPYPLALLMLQGLELVRLSSEFQIKTETGDRMLELKDGKVWGLPVLVDIFLRQNDMTNRMFQGMVDDAVAAVSSKQQNSDSN